ncbi:MAG TPA: efflux RND transporter periplasmic adaptor subunit [Tepidisphaeraceae bacterium]|jgi:HlyD family secretion protein|nr:efflux RND transporter periplasmic adaptor subunit [Tepidisphaeraceae bacterium]
MSIELETLRIDPAKKAPPPSSRRPGRWIALAAVGAVLIIGVLWLIKPAAAIDVQAMRVPAPSADTGDDVVLNATGYIVAAHKIELAPKVDGRVAWIGVDMGDKVQAGQVLVRLEDDEYKARVLQQQGLLDAAKAALERDLHGSRPEEIDQARAMVDQAQADLKDATLNMQRNQELAGTKALSQQAIDDSVAKYMLDKAKLDSVQAAYELVKEGPRAEDIAAQRAMVEQAQGELDQANVDLNNAEIRAPIAGTVLERNVEVGEYVTTGFVGAGGAKGYVVSLADLHDLKVELDISQSDFPKIGMGQRAIVTTDAFPDHKYQGIVDQISPEADRAKATVLVKVKILDPDSLLRPDMNASVAFHPAPRRGAAAGFSAPPAPPAPPSPTILIPATAIRGGDVFIIKSGKAVAKPVTIAQSFADGVRITSGLSPGELLVVDPPAALSDGHRVNYSLPAPPAGLP